MNNYLSLCFFNNHIYLLKYTEKIVWLKMDESKFFGWIS